MSAAETKKLVERLVLDVLEASDAFCMDVDAERRALADALTVDLMGRFAIKPLSRGASVTVLARVLEGNETSGEFDGI